MSSYVARGPQRHLKSIRAYPRYVQAGLVKDFAEYLSLSPLERSRMRARLWKREHAYDSGRNAREWRQRFPEKVQTYVEANGARIRQDYMSKLRAQVYELLGNQCACPRCESKDIQEFLCIDHIQPIRYPKRSDGRNALSSSDRNRLFRTILAHPDPRSEYRLLCWNCNSATRYFRACPHNREEVRDFHVVVQRLLNEGVVG